MTWRFTGPDAAVSEVVGYVLVTGITVVMIVLVVLMSSPTLDRIQSDQAHDSMVGYFHDLDQSFSKILSGSPMGSTPLWRVALPGGASVSVDNGPGHMWAYAVDHHEDKKLYYEGFDDAGDTFTVQAKDPGEIDGDITFQAWKWEGTERVDDDFGLCDPDCELTWDLGGSTTEVRFSDNQDTNFARVWIVDAGSVDWTRPGQDQFQILYQNTGIISLRDGGELMQNQPRIPAPQALNDDEDEEHVFVRITKVQGAVSIGGQTSATLLVSSDGTNVRHSTATAERVQIYPATSAITAWERHLTDETRGFDYDWDPDDQDIPVAVKDKQEELHVTFLQTEVTLGLQGGV